MLAIRVEHPVTEGLDALEALSSNPPGMSISVIRNLLLYHVIHGFCFTCRQASTEEGGSPQDQQPEAQAEAPEMPDTVTQEADHPSPSREAPSPHQEFEEGAQGGVVDLTARRGTTSTTARSRAGASAPATQGPPEELEEIMGRPEKPKRILGKVSYIARQDEDGEWQVFESKVDAPIQENIKASLKQLTDEIQVLAQNRNSTWI